MEHDDIIIMLTRLEVSVEILRQRVEELLQTDFVKKRDLGNLIDEHLQKRNESNISKTNNIFTLLKNIGIGIAWLIAIGVSANGLLQLLK